MASRSMLGEKLYYAVKAEESMRKASHSGGGLELSRIDATACNMASRTMLRKGLSHALKAQKSMRKNPHSGDGVKLSNIDATAYYMASRSMLGEKLYYAVKAEESMRKASHSGGGLELSRIDATACDMASRSMLGEKLYHAVKADESMRKASHSGGGVKLSRIDTAVQYMAARTVSGESPDVALKNPHSGSRSNMSRIDAAACFGRGCGFEQLRGEVAHSATNLTRSRNIGSSLVGCDGRLEHRATLDTEHASRETTDLGRPVRPVEMRGTPRHMDSTPGAGDRARRDQVNGMLAHTGTKYYWDQRNDTCYGDYGYRCAWRGPDYHGMDYGGVLDCMLR